MRNVRLRTARFAAGVSAEELAETLKVHRTTVSRWENGHRSPTLDQLRVMAKALGTTASYLAGDHDDEEAA